MNAFEGATAANFDSVADGLPATTHLSDHAGNDCVDRPIEHTMRDGNVYFLPRTHSYAATLQHSLAHYPRSRSETTLEAQEMIDADEALARIVENVMRMAGPAYAEVIRRSDVLRSVLEQVADRESLPYFIERCVNLAISVSKYKDVHVQNTTDAYRVLLEKGLRKTYGTVLNRTGFTPQPHAAAANIDIVVNPVDASVEPDRITVIQTDIAQIVQQAVLASSYPEYAAEYAAVVRTSRALRAALEKPTRDEAYTKLLIGYCTALATKPRIGRLTRDVHKQNALSAFHVLLEKGLRAMQKIKLPRGSSTERYQCQNEAKARDILIAFQEKIAQEVEQRSGKEFANAIRGADLSNELGEISIVDDGTIELLCFAHARESIIGAATRLRENAKADPNFAPHAVDFSSTLLASRSAIVMRHVAEVATESERAGSRVLKRKGHDSRSAEERAREIGLAALFHDAGKSYLGLQRKIRNFGTLLPQIATSKNIDWVGGTSYHVDDFTTDAGITRTIQRVFQAEEPYAKIVPPWAVKEFATVINEHAIAGYYTMMETVVDKKLQSIDGLDERHCDYFKSAFGVTEFFDDFLEDKLRVAVVADLHAIGDLPADPLLGGIPLGPLFAASTVEALHAALTNRAANDEERAAIDASHTSGALEKAFVALAAHRQTLAEKVGGTLNQAESPLDQFGIPSISASDPATNNAAYIEAVTRTLLDIDDLRVTYCVPARDHHKPCYDRGWPVGDKLVPNLATEVVADRDIDHAKQNRGFCAGRAGKMRSGHARLLASIVTEESQIHKLLIDDGIARAQAIGSFERDGQITLDLLARDFGWLKKRLTQPDGAHGYAAQLVRRLCQLLPGLSKLSKEETDHLTTYWAGVIQTGYNKMVDGTEKAFSLHIIAKQDVATIIAGASCSDGMTFECLNRDGQVNKNVDLLLESAAAEIAAWKLEGQDTAAVAMVKRYTGAIGELRNALRDRIETAAGNVMDALESGLHRIRVDIRRSLDTACNLAAETATMP